MERTEDKKQRLARLAGIEKLGKGRKPQPVKQPDGTYRLTRAVVTSPFVGEVALGKVLRINGTEDIVTLRWDKERKCYNVTSDENASEGNIIEFTLVYGEDKD